MRQQRYEEALRQIIKLVKDAPSRRHNQVTAQGREIATLNILEEIEYCANAALQEPPVK
jgi:hypothetical protein